MPVVPAVPLMMVMELVTPTEELLNKTSGVRLLGHRPLHTTGSLTAVTAVPPRYLPWPSLFLGAPWQSYASNPCSPSYVGHANCKTLRQDQPNQTLYKNVGFNDRMLQHIMSRHQLCFQ